MGHKITVSMPFSDAEKLRDLGRDIAKDTSLGINQSVHVILESILLGRVTLSTAKGRGQKAVVESKEED